ncbi:MAG: helix-turn-helix domain-containing protein [Desulfurococcales archaeon]|nr:helix-turn-helix domain-containing protein [Desulfurococcales archaeon]
MTTTIDSVSLCDLYRRLGTIKAVAEETGLSYWKTRSILLEACPEVKRKSRKRADEVRDRVCRMIEEGYRIQDIVEELGIGVGLAIRLAKECGWVQKRTWRQMTVEERIEACKMLRECWPEPGCQRSIAEAIGRSEATVSRLVRWCRERGLLPP